MFKRFEELKFLFEELVKRDFIKKYKRTILGIGWSVLSPLLMMFVMQIVFYHFFGIQIENYATYLLCGQIIFNYYTESTNDGMMSLYENSAILTKMNVPKYLFIFSKNVAGLINFSCTLIVLFACIFVEGVELSWRVILIIFPIICILVFNLGIGMILSALFVFFRDIKWLYGVFLQALGYVSGIFYDINTFSPMAQKMFMLNPIFVYIKYFRAVVMYKEVPGLFHHFLCILYATITFIIGLIIYKKNNYKFVYYI